MKNPRVFIVLTGLVLLLSGCAGVGVIHPKAREITNFSDKNYGKEAVLKAKGKPNGIEKVGDSDEIWRYFDGFNWVGGVLMLGIPIPFALPIVPVNRYIYFSGDTVTKTTYSLTGWSGFCLCPENEGNMKYGFHALK